MRKATTSLLILAALAIGGCKQTGFLAKREAEKCCPTDIRKTVPWCAGEDAIFHAPCEPSASFYGYKPTCWGIWPTSGAVWRDTHCGNLHHEAVITNLTNQNPELISLPQLESEPLPVVESNPLPIAPEPPSFPLEKSIKIEPSEDIEEEIEIQPAEEKEAAEAREEAAEEDLPNPTLGPIRLPDIDSE